MIVEGSLQRELHAELLELMTDFREFGMTASGGLTRLAASKAEGRARDYLCSWLRNQGFSVLVDPIGNIFGVLDLGVGSKDQVFYCGSHLDSQPEGGHFDGVLGVASACIAGLFLRSAIAAGKFRPKFRYFVVCCWTAEEGARFQPSLIGSSVFTGQLGLQTAWAIADKAGVHLKHALKATGYLGSDHPPRPTHYLELHVEQGTRLERAGDAIGLVETCWGAEKIRVMMSGKADHTGPTPMKDRRDALLAASHLVVEVERISTSAQSVLHGSVGRLLLHPNSPNTVVGQAELWVEFRSASTKARCAALAQLKAFLPIIEKLTGCACTISNQETREVTAFDSAALRLASSALEEVGTPFQKLDSIAGHDAIRLQDICPSTLLFAPSRDGISHSPLEFTSDQDVCLAFDAMTVVLSKLIS